MQPSVPKFQARTGQTDGRTDEVQCVMRDGRIIINDSVCVLQQRNFSRFKKVALLLQTGRAMYRASLSSLNTTMPRAQSFIISYFGFRFTNAYK